MNHELSMKALWLGVALITVEHLGCKGNSTTVHDAQPDLTTSIAEVPASGGHTTGGASGGIAGTGGVVGSGGVTGVGGSGNPCLDSSGAVSATVKACTTVNDCTQATIRTCCGSDLAVGLAKTASCTFPVPNCSGLGCAKMLYPRTDDGDTANADSMVDVRCLAGLCSTFVNRPPGAGGGSGTGGGSGSGGASGIDAATVDAGTGACVNDGDCVFRTSAGCCGQCLAVSDPVPPTIPCGAMCPVYSACACVNGRCSLGSLSRGSSCETTHDLCQPGTKCCAVCGTDGSSSCAAPVCTTPGSSTSGVSCPMGGA
jgi:hypothetical protein